LPPGYEWNRASLGLGIRHVTVPSDLVSNSCDLERKPAGDDLLIGTVNNNDFVTGSRYESFANENSESKSIYLMRGFSPGSAFIVISPDFSRDQGRYFLFSFRPKIGDKNLLYWFALPFAILADGFLCPLEWVMFANQK